MWPKGLGRFHFLYVEFPIPPHHTHSHFLFPVHLTHRYTLYSISLLSSRTELNVSSSGKPLPTFPPHPNSVRFNRYIYVCVCVYIYHIYIYIYIYTHTYTHTHTEPYSIPSGDLFQFIISFISVAICIMSIASMKLELDRQGLLKHNAL